MKLLSFLFLTLSLLPGYATTVTVYSGSGILDSEGNAVGPYPGNVNGQSYNLFCDDYSHDIVAGQVVNVTVSTISDLSQTRFGNVPNALADYEQMFYLSGFLLTANPNNVPYVSDTNQPVQADIQDAIWSYSNSNAPNLSSDSVQYWLNLAAQNYSNGNYSNFRILTDSADQFNGAQELFFNSAAPTPEPSTGFLVLGALAGAAVILRRRKAVVTAEKAQQ